LIGCIGRAVEQKFAYPDTDQIQVALYFVYVTLHCFSGLLDRPDLTIHLLRSTQGCNAGQEQERQQRPESE
jgi:hypothetical protein